MNRIDNLFQNKKQDILSIYFPAGYPNLNDTVPNLELLQTAGVDMVEIGIPFSDPLADGSAIQAAAKQSLDNGMKLRLLFEQLKDARQTVSMPLILMGYWNTIYRYGVDQFLKDCKKIGIDGLIIPDLPLEEFEAHYKSDFEEYGIYNVLLACPETDEVRFQKLITATQGFLYLVSSSATTGGSVKLDEEHKAYFNRIKKIETPSLIGFGINNKESFNYACQYANGAIVGTAFIKALKKNKAKDFIKKIK
ncbi:tryptophan synthase subunit alpha [Ancylomarina euxinus]|uniref:Tryptophan synthase alpha chain n=1 Tax=Ancylomarina euxinus TaxID=2283627 RepID=A0A425XXD7_9BACT|nr:tryptophan synthase subunit alpha [Ancylomarina euxinus]MCZ4696115.1 tryptophan synthase subunit alpha [Ancylomarina euxinus]MUP16524.1 tryptophan synthase subunit alpha [Ancylomarina euxinus]RRG19328.1 tryptophan synthase subunit alpha [Ancylomarina euxinus]